MKLSLKARGGSLRQRRRFDKRRRRPRRRFSNRGAALYSSGDFDGPPIPPPALPREDPTR